MKLPKIFEEKMKGLLGRDYEAFLASYEKENYSGLRINTLKINREEWKEKNPFHTLETVPWCNEGFYYFKEDKPTKHAFYYAGLYYIQEPSAMAPGAYIPIEKGDRVLDLCSAPGGKATQIAAKLGQEGILVANDISATRAKALLKNIENFGIRNAVVTNETPERLAAKLEGYFDKILIDAPCSGEGMFRKHEKTISSYEKHGVSHCTSLQKEILEYADKMLKVNGMMLYSTCTFSPEENEGMLDNFLKKHPYYKVIPLEPVGGIEKGRPQWAHADQQLEGALRLWPHLLEGEGHFLCLLQKTDGEEKKSSLLKKEEKLKSLKEAADFVQEHTSVSLESSIMEFKDKIFLLPDDMPDLSGLRVKRSGLLLGEYKNKRFEPAHAMALAYSKEQFKHCINLSSQDEKVYRYLKGETLMLDVPKGYHVLCVDDYPLGFVKSQNGMLKNQYPPSWRMMG